MPKRRHDSGDSAYSVSSSASSVPPTPEPPSLIEEYKAEGVAHYQQVRSGKSGIAHDKGSKKDFIKFISLLEQKHISTAEGTENPKSRTLLNPEPKNSGLRVDLQKVMKDGFKYYEHLAAQTNVIPRKNSVTVAQTHVQLGTEIPIKVEAVREAFKESYDRQTIVELYEQQIMPVWTTTPVSAGKSRKRMVQSDPTLPEVRPKKRGMERRSYGGVCCVGDNFTPTKRRAQ